MVKRRFLKLLGLLPFVSSSQTASLAETDQSLSSTVGVTKDDHQVSIFPFECETVHGAEAYARWKDVKSSGEYYPVILGSDRELEYLSDNYSINKSKNLSPNISDDFDFPKEFIRLHETEIAEFYDDDDGVTDFKQSVKNIIENWTDEPFDESQSEPSVVKNLEGQYHDHVHIALIPTDDWTVIPSLLQFGGWNACPQDAWHVAAFRYWRKKYGAELVSMTHDTVEMQVKHRPQMLEDAVTLAMEQYIYCNDIVDQGVGEPALLAKFLMQSNFWYFWWD